MMRLFAMVAFAAASLLATGCGSTTDGMLTSNAVTAPPNDSSAPRSDLTDPPADGGTDGDAKRDADTPPPPDLLDPNIPAICRDMVTTGMVMSGWACWGGNIRCNFKLEDYDNTCVAVCYEQPSNDFRMYCLMSPEMLSGSTFDCEDIRRMPQPCTQ